jgi:hypothetical protein
MAARRASSSKSKKVKKTIDDKIKKCNEYLNSVNKQTKPSDQEKLALNNKLLELEKLKSIKGGKSTIDSLPKVVCNKPKSLDVVKKIPVVNVAPVVASASGGKKKLSGGEIAGIVIGSIVGLIILTLILMEIHKKLKKIN